MRYIFNRMVNNLPDPLSSTFAALADPTRRAILARLAAGEATVGELASPFDMSLPAVSKHLTVLEGAGLIARERDGRLRRCRIRAKSLRAASEWIETYRRFWEDQLSALATYLEEEGRRLENGGDNGKRAGKGRRKR
jgi:DNA-binding transcriptional ArsR family regulator